MQVDTGSETACVQTRMSGFRVLITKINAVKRHPREREVSISFASPQFHSTPRFSPAALDLWQSAHVVWLLGDYVSEDEN